MRRDRVRSEEGRGTETERNLRKIMGAASWLAVRTEVKIEYPARAQGRRRAERTISWLSARREDIRATPGARAPESTRSEPGPADSEFLI